MFNLNFIKMKKLLFIPILFMSLNLFSQDIKYGDGLFEANFTVDMMYTNVFRSLYFGWYNQWIFNIIAKINNTIWF